MNARERLLAAEAFREADRVPIELNLSPGAAELPGMERVAEFCANEADNYHGIAAIDWGFFGLDSVYSEEIIEDVPGEYRRIRRMQRTPAGDFYAVTKHNYPHLDSSDYHWERRYIDTLDEFVRLAEAPRTVRPFDRALYEASCAGVGGRGLPYLALAHPLGTLVRQANMERVYLWLLAEPAVTHRFLENANRQVIATIESLGRQGISGWFFSYAHEMLIPPWMGHRLFDEVVFPYDKAVNDAVHAIGGKHRSHCHGACFDFLTRMAEMGVDATEPLEPAPWGNNDLAAAKRLVGGRMMLSGNVPSQDFVTMRPEEAREWVRRAIRAAAPGGGFTLRTTGGNADVDPDLPRDMLANIIACANAFVEAGLEFGQYPLRV